MRKLSLLLLLTTCFSFSQNKQVLYGLPESPQSLLINPGGKIENDWYFGIPFLSHIHANVGFSGVTAFDLFADNPIPFGEKVTNVINQLDENDFFGANQQIELLSGGFAIDKNGEKENYLSFGLYQETDAIVYFPEDLADLGIEGNANNIGRVFNLNQVKASLESLLVFHAGYTKKVNKKLNYGVRGKVYYSLINASSIDNTGTFVTREGRNNFYDHVFDLDLELRTSGVKGLSPTDGPGALLKGGNFGLGVDLGLTYALTKQTTIDASLQDIGFIRHSKDVENYIINNQYTFSGINPLFPDVSTAETAEAYWDEIEDNFDELIELRKTDNSYTTFRPVKFNAALRYAFGTGNSNVCDCLNNNEGYLNGIGVQLYSISRPKNVQNALTVYYYRKLFEALRLKGTYTIDSYSFRNLGLGMSAHIKNINFYLVADNLLDFQNLAKAKSASVQLGFNYIYNQK